MSSSESKRVVYAALAGNLAIAVTKAVAALWTGSSAMLSEAIHSAVDTGNQGLLLYGMGRAARPPDAGHPFGHGMEFFFWSFVVALLIFALGGAVSIYEGVHRLADLEPVENAATNFLVLGASGIFEGLSFRVAWQEFRKAHRGEGFFAAIRRSKDPSVFAVLLEDLAALCGLVIAAIGLGLAVWLGDPAFDAAASIAIGLLLVGAAIMLARETKSLMTGEAASRRVVEGARQILTADPRVTDVREVLSLQLGPREVLLGVSIDLEDSLSGPAIEQAAEELTHRLRAAYPEVTRLFLRPAGSGAVPPPAPGS